MTSGDSSTVWFAYKRHSDEHDAATRALNARAIADWSASFLTVDLRGSETHRRMCLCTFTADADGVARGYDGHSERAFTSSLRRCTICLVRRMSPSLRPTPKVDAIARKRAFKSL